MKLIKKAVNYTVLKAGSAYGKICRNKLRKKSEDIDKVSEKLLLDLVWRNRNTEYGKKYDFAGIKSVEDYQDKVPLSSYDDYREYINRIAENGEQGLLTSDKVVFFAKTSGSTGETKRIPVVKKATKPYTETVVAYINIIKTEMKKRGIHCGKGLITAEMESNPTESNIREGLISAYTLESGKAVFQRKYLNIVILWI